MDADSDIGLSEQLASFLLVSSQSASLSEQLASFPLVSSQSASFPLVSPHQQSSISFLIFSEEVSFQILL